MEASVFFPVLHTEIQLFCLLGSGAEAKEQAELDCINIFCCSYIPNACITWGAYRRV